MYTFPPSTSAAGSPRYLYLTKGLEVAVNVVSFLSAGLAADAAVAAHASRHAARIFFMFFVFGLENPGRMLTPHIKNTNGRGIFRIL